MPLIPEALKAGASGVAGAVKAGARQMSLSFMNVDKDTENNDNDEGEPDKREPLNKLGVLLRIIICPLFVPIYIIYIFLIAKGAPIAAELEAVDEAMEDSDDEDDSNGKFGLLHSIGRWILGIKDPKKKDDPFKETYEKFLARQMKQRSHKVQLAPYIVATDVARTDKVQFPYDGVFIHNMFIDINDSETLESMLQQLEKDLLAEKNASDMEEETDEWSNTPTGVTAGDSKILLQHLLSQAKLGQRKLQQGETPYAQRRRAQVSEETKSEAEAADGVDTTPSKSAAGAESKSTGKNKPKKAPVPEGTPLLERMNLAVALNIAVEGPRLDSAPTAITEHYKSRG